MPLLPGAEHRAVHVTDLPRRQRTPKMRGAATYRDRGWCRAAWDIVFRARQAPTAALLERQLRALPRYQREPDYGDGWEELCGSWIVLNYSSVVDFRSS